MGAKELANRDNWQAGANISKKEGENMVENALLKAAKRLSLDLRLARKGKIRNIYYDAGYHIEADIMAYDNSGKRLFIEVKTQGFNQGNATIERACKYLSSGIAYKNIFKQTGNPPVLFFFGLGFSIPQNSQKVRDMWDCDGNVPYYIDDGKQNLEEFVEGLLKKTFNKA